MNFQKSLLSAFTSAFADPFADNLLLTNNAIDNPFGVSSNIINTQSVFTSKGKSNFLSFPYILNILKMWKLFRLSRKKKN